MDIQPYSGTSTIQHLISKSRDFIFLVNLMSTRLCVKASLQNGLNQIIFRPLIFPIFQLELYAVKNSNLPKQNVRTKRTNNYHNLCAVLGYSIVDWEDRPSTARARNPFYLDWTVMIWRCLGLPMSKQLPLLCICIQK